MKKYISLAMLSARAVFYWLLAMMAVLFSAQWIMQLKRIADYQAVNEKIYSIMFVSGIGTQSKWMFYGVVLLFCVIAARHGSGAGTQLTIKRLRISEANVALVWGMYYTLCLLFLWCAQMVNIVAMMCYTEAHIPGLVPNEQAKLVVFYNDIFFHSCLPLEDGTMYVNNVVMMLGIGMSCSYSSWLMRRGKIPVIVFVLIGMLVFVWNSSLQIGWGTMIMVVLFELLSLIYMAVRVRGDKLED